MKNIISVTEEIDRIWNECIQVAVEDGIINPWNFMHPYRNNYEIAMEVEGGISSEIIKEISTGAEILRVVTWYKKNSVEVQGVLTYREKQKVA